MDVYDTANKLSEEIRNSEQFKALKEAKEKLFADEEKKKIIEEFEQLKQEVQIMEMKQQANQEVDQEDKKLKLAKLYNVLVEHEDIKNYFDKQEKYLKDININNGIYLSVIIYFLNEIKEKYFVDRFIKYLELNEEDKKIIMANIITK